MGASVKMQYSDIYEYLSRDTAKRFKTQSSCQYETSLFGLINTCTYNIKKTITIPVLHFLAATTIAFSCSFYCFKAECKKVFLWWSFLNPDKN